MVQHSSAWISGGRAEICTVRSEEQGLGKLGNAAEWRGGEWMRMAKDWRGEVRKSEGCARLGGALSREVAER
jgi:hypothetical protein